MKQNLFSILVSNHFGVLMRVTTIFSRRTCNIKSLTVAETHDPSVSRITILFEADTTMANQIAKLLEKQEDVHSVTFLSLETPILRELLLIKIKPSMYLQDDLKQLPAGTHAQVIAEDKDNCVVEFVGTGLQCDDFVRLMEQHTILEVCRTGAVALNKESLTEDFNS